MHQASSSYESSIIRPSWRWSYEHGKNYTRWLNHEPISTRKNHALSFMIMRIKHNPTILTKELLTWKQLHKMVTSDVDQYTKKSWKNFHDQMHRAQPNHLGVGLKVIKIQKLFELNNLICTHPQMPLVLTFVTAQCY